MTVELVFGVLLVIVSLLVTSAISVLYELREEAWVKKLSAPFLSSFWSYLDLRKKLSSERYKESKCSYWDQNSKWVLGKFHDRLYLLLKAAVDLSLLMNWLNTLWQRGSCLFNNYAYMIHTKAPQSSVLVLLPHAYHQVSPLLTRLAKTTHFSL